MAGVHSFSQLSTVRFNRRLSNAQRIMLEAPAPNVAQGLELRPLSLSDAEGLFRGVEANRCELRQWLPWVDGVQSPQNVTKFIEHSIEERNHDRSFQLGVWVDGVIRGVIGTHPIDKANRSISFGYWLAAEVQGSGVMTACCRHVIAHLFERLGLHRVVIRCAAENAKSRAIPTRLGFHQEGVLRDAEWLYDHFVDLVVYARIADENLNP